jgi:tetratricopeptide (TPR) repeat protein
MYRIRPLSHLSPDASATSARVSLSDLSDASRRAEDLVRLAWRCQQSNEPEAAIQAYLEAAAQVEPSDPRRNWRVLVPIKNNLASLHSAAGRVEEAEACYIQAINLMETCDVEHGQVSLSSLYSNLAILYGRIGLAEAAVRMQSKSLACLNQAPGLNAKKRFQALQVMEGFCQRAGRSDLVPDLIKQRDQLAAMLSGAA